MLQSRSPNLIGDRRSEAFFLVKIDSSAVDVQSIVFFTKIFILTRSLICRRVGRVTIVKKADELFIGAEITVFIDKEDLKLDQGVNKRLACFFFNHLINIVV